METKSNKVMDINKLINLRDFHLSKFEQYSQKIGERLQKGSDEFLFNAAHKACMPYHDISIEAIRGNTLKRVVTIQRQIMQALLMRNCHQLNQHKIGKMFNRDRSTCVHSLQVVMDQCDVSRVFKEEFQAIEAKFKSLIL